MKKLIFVPLAFSALLLMVGCKSYEDKEYGPLSYTIDMEDGDSDLFEGPIEGITTIIFKPEDFGFSKESVGGMRLKEITLKTENSSGFGVFENLKVEVSSANTDMLTIGVLNSVPNSNEVTITGLDEAKIKNFNDVNEFHLHISGNLKESLEEAFSISGEFTLRVESTEKEDK
jgi:hypothetical protein